MLQPLEYSLDEAKGEIAMSREAMDFDLVIVGAGPAGLSAAIRFRQLCQQHGKDFSVCVVEKGAEIGAHSLSGAVLEPRTLNELIPDWEEKGAPLDTAVTNDDFLYLTPNKAFRLPTPRPMHNHGNYIISLGLFTRWLGEQAESLGADIYPGFAASEVLYDEQQQVYGIATGDMGISKQGEHKDSFQAGMELHANQTLLAEGCRGSLSKQVCEKFNLQKDAQPQTYAIGIKEIWRIDSAQHKPGHVLHTIGWPLMNDTYGGSFIYHLKDDQQIAVGFVVGLDYSNPYLEPFAEMQRFKTHPNMRPLFDNAERLSYGARALNEGGWQSIPQLVFPGGALIGCAAGFLNVPKIKGIHTAMKSGMLAAESAFEALQNDTAKQSLDGYSTAVNDSWLKDELYRVRNIRPAFRRGLWAGLAWSAFDTYVLQGRWPWTFNHHADHLSLKPANTCQAINYPKPDGKITFDKLSSVYLSNTFHEEDQPIHLQLKQASIAIDTNLAIYDAPEQRYCPAGVYEIISDNAGNKQLQINAQNCVHCKSCDIKDPTQNINWAPPEGGGGPNYTSM